MEKKIAKVGDIVVCSWGYSMTLYDFFQVTKISEKSVWLQQVEKAVVGGDGFHPEVVPSNAVSRRNPQVFRRTIDKSGYVNWTSNRAISLSPWDGVSTFSEDHMD